MRKYNDKISERANESLRQRELVVRKQRTLVVVIVLALISLGILLGTSVNAMASSEGDVASYYKYYTSIRIEAGDTLWDIAEEYTEDLNISREEYIAEVCELNGIFADDIKTGAYIVVPYYSLELK